MKAAVVDLMIRNIVGQCHVGKGNRAVIREVVSRIGASWRTLPRHTRKAVMRAAIREHGRNRDLYRRVMSGRF